MRLSDFCNRLSTRAPCTPPDSRSPTLLHPAELAPGGALSSHRVELRLTANLQLRVRCNRLGHRSGRSPSLWLVEHPRVAGERRSNAPLRGASRCGCFSPRAERAASPLTSSVAIALWSCHEQARTAPANAGLIVGRSLVKGCGLEGARMSSVDEYPRVLPLPAKAYASRSSLPPCLGTDRRKGLGSGGSATVLLTLPSGAGFQRRCCPAVTRPARRSHIPGGIASRPTLSSTSATRTACEHHHVPSEPRLQCGVDPPSSRWVGSLAPDEVVAPSVDPSTCLGDAGCRALSWFHA